VYITEEERIVRRAEKIESWFDYLDDLYGGLISRPEETASLSGWDDRPKVRRCECRVQWQRGRLCLACDNTGWRKLAAGETGIDPYSAGVKARSSFLLVESDGARRARASRQMDATIATLEQNGLIRKGIEIAEGNDARVFRLIGSKNGTLAKILQALSFLHEIDREAVRGASRQKLARALAHIVPGRLHCPPS
jgi:hypothetical protein